MNQSFDLKIVLGPLCVESCAGFRRVPVLPSPTRWASSRWANKPDHRGRWRSSRVRGLPHRSRDAGWWAAM